MYPLQIAPSFAKIDIAKVFLLEFCSFSDFSVSNGWRKSIMPDCRKSVRQDMR